MGKPTNTDCNSKCQATVTQVSSAKDMHNGEPGFLKFIAYLQIIGIILVVFGHSFHQYPDGHNGTSMLIYRLFYSFRMPLFMFVSGFLMIYTTFKRGNRTPKIRHFALKKVKRLLIPYVVLTLVTYIPRASMSGVADDTLPVSVKGLLESLYLTDRLPIPYFWFIQASFLLLIVCYAIISLSKRTRVPSLVVYTSLFAALLFGGLYAPTGEEIFSYRHAMNIGIFFILGAVYCDYYEYIDKYLPLDSWASGIYTFILWIITFMLWEGTAFIRISSLFGIAMCISASKLLVKYRVTLLDHLIGANYLIFLLSWYFNVITQQILAHYIVLPWWIHTILSLIFGIYIPWLAYRWLLHNQHHRIARALSFILGQSFKNKH